MIVPVSYGSIVFKIFPLLSFLDETIPENALDTRTRGIGRNKQGSVIWSIPKDLPFKSGMFQGTLRPHLHGTG